MHNLFIACDAREEMKGLVDHILFVMHMDVLSLLTLTATTKSYKWRKRTLLLELKVFI